MVFISNLLKNRDISRNFGDSRLELAGIPLEAPRYQVSSRSALGWLMANNTGNGIRADRDSSIVYDPNEGRNEVGDMCST